MVKDSSKQKTCEKRTEASWIETHIKCLHYEFSAHRINYNYTKKQLARIDYWMRKWWNADDYWPIAKPDEIIKDEKTLELLDD